MSVNTSEEYLDELLQAIEPIIDMDQTDKITEQPLSQPVQEEDAAIGELLAGLTSETVQESTDVQGSPVGDIDYAEPVSGDSDMDVKTLLEQFAAEEDLTGMEQMTLDETILPDITNKEDRLENGEQFRPEESLIEEFLMGDDSIEELPLEEPFMGETTTEKGLTGSTYIEAGLTEETDAKETVAENVPAGDEEKKGFLGFLKKKKKKTRDALTEMESEATAEMEEIPEVMEEIPEAMEEIPEVTAENPDFAEMSLDDILGDGDFGDIDALLSAGAFDEIGVETAALREEKSAEKGSSKEEAGKKGFFGRIFEMLTEEEEETAHKNPVPEAEETGITNENETILEELSKEEKKKRKKEEKERKKKEKRKKNGGAESETEENEEGEEKNDKKKNKGRKKVKKEKPRKVVDLDEKPSKKIPKKRIALVYIFCFSILAMILILQTVILDANNTKEARWAFDNADYETCYADLYGENRSKEEEDLFQKSYLVLCVQRKLDSFNNRRQMGLETEALDALFEGVRVYRNLEEKAASYGVLNRMDPILETIMENLRAYGLTDADIDEILAYESKVSYTKRLESIANGTPYIENEWLPMAGGEEALDAADTQKPLTDILPMEEDFLPEDGILKEQTDTEVTVQETSEEPPQESQEENVQHTTTVVGSSPVNISDSVQ